MAIQYVRDAGYEIVILSGGSDSHVDSVMQKILSDNGLKPDKITGKKCPAIVYVLDESFESKRKMEESVSGFTAWYKKIQSNEVP